MSTIAAPAGTRSISVCRFARKRSRGTCCGEGLRQASFAPNQIVARRTGAVAVDEPGVGNSYEDHRVSNTWISYRVVTRTVSEMGKAHSVLYPEKPRFRTSKRRAYASMIKYRRDRDIVMRRDSG